MARKLVKKSFVDSEFARPLFALALLGLLYLAFKVGLIGIVSNILIAPLKPSGPTNAGELYRQQMEQGQQRLTGSARETGV